jgi:hypothetical protein
MNNFLVGLNQDPGREISRTIGPAQLAKSRVCGWTGLGMQGCVKKPTEQEAENVLYSHGDRFQFDVLVSTCFSL